jgi:hypothetical protein
MSEAEVEDKTTDEQAEVEEHIVDESMVIGPPAYGSPFPETSTGRLLPLAQHPFNSEDLPEDHPAAIDPSYGEGYPEGGEEATPTAGGLMAGEDGENVEYDSHTKADLLTEAQSRNLDVTNSNTKAEIIEALEEDDAANEDEPAE